MDSVAKAPYAARCEVCDLPAVDTLRADPTVPLYACGSTPLRSVHNAMERFIRPSAGEPNVVPLTLDDVRRLHAIGSDVVLADSPVSWTPDPRIALGPCGHVTIAGECLALDDPGRARLDLL